MVFFNRFFNAVQAFEGYFVVDHCFSLTHSKKLQIPKAYVRYMQIAEVFLAVHQACTSPQKEHLKNNKDFVKNKITNRKMKTAELF